MKQKLKIFLCIVFFAVIGWPNIHSKNNSEYPSKHYRDLQDWRERLEHEKEKEKKKKRGAILFILVQNKFLIKQLKLLQAY